MFHRELNYWTRWVSEKTEWCSCHFGKETYFSSKQGQQITSLLSNTYSINTGKLLASSVVQRDMFLTRQTHIIYIKPCFRQQVLPLLHPKKKSPPSISRDFLNRAGRREYLQVTTARITTWITQKHKNMAAIGEKIDRPSSFHGLLLKEQYTKSVEWTCHLPPLTCCFQVCGGKQLLCFLVY